MESPLKEGYSRDKHEVEEKDISLCDNRTRNKIDFSTLTHFNHNNTSPKFSINETQHAILANPTERRRKGGKRK